MVSSRTRPLRTFPKTRQRPLPYKVTFGPQDILYHCANFPILTPSEDDTEDGGEPDEDSYWDNSNGDSWYENYRQRNNPCHQGFYRDFDDHKVDISRNVVVSNIGVVAKKGSGNQLTIIATDLNSAEPLSGASVSLLDYQQEFIVEEIMSEGGEELVMDNTIEESGTGAVASLSATAQNLKQKFLGLLDKDQLEMCLYPINSEKQCKSYKDVDAAAKAACDLTG